MLQDPPRLVQSGSLWKTASLFVIPLLLLSAGCGDSCFVFVSSPGTGTVIIGGSNLGATCGFAKPQPHAAVQVVAHVARVCEGCSDSNQVRSIFVTLSGVDLRTRPDAVRQQQPNWHKLLPASDVQPLQIDLMGPNAIASVPVGPRTEVPAGTYDLVRLRFAYNQDSTVRPTEQNPCGSVGLNCTIMQDGRVQPLLLNTNPPELLIASTEPANSLLFVAPGSDNELSLDLTPLWSAALPPGEHLRFALALTGTAKIQRKLSVDEPNPVAAAGTE